MFTIDRSYPSFSKSRPIKVDQSTIANIPEVRLA
jgi:hypothetical protein